MIIFALGFRHDVLESHRHRIPDIRFLQVVIKLGRFKNQATVQLGNHRRNMWAMIPVVCLKVSAETG